MLDLEKVLPWEIVVYGYYIAHDNSKALSKPHIIKHGRQGLSWAFINGVPFMAKAKAKPNGTGSYTAVTWVNYSITDENVIEIEGWQPSQGEIFAAIIALVSTGHSFTVKQSPNGDGFMAAATGNTDDCPNKGLGLSAYADEPTDAVKVLLFKHHGVFDGVWPKGEGNSKRKYR